MTIKDAMTTTGLPSTFGLPPLKNYIPKKDGAVVASLKKAGAIIFGKMNVPFASYDWQCKSPHFGRTSNPWNLRHTPGGSSGGAGAALAAGFTPLEVGSDIAGSIRYPAHCCGVYGLRTTEALVPLAGLVPPKLASSLKSIVVLGPMARSIDDLRLALHVIQDSSVRIPMLRTPEKLKIGWTDMMVGIQASDETSRLLQNFLQQLEKEGHSVRRASPEKLDLEEAYALWGEIVGFEYVPLLPGPMKKAYLRKFIARPFIRLAFGRSAFSEGFARGILSKPRDYEKAIQRREELMRMMDEFLSEFDLWVTPVAPTEAISHRRIGSSIRVDKKTLTYSEALGAFLCPTALTGQPILSIPIGQAQSGLPVGVQLHGRRGQDFHLLDLAEKIHMTQKAAPASWPEL
jgi:amidase